MVIVKFKTPTASTLFMNLKNKLEKAYYLLTTANILYSFGKSTYETSSVGCKYLKEYNLYESAKSRKQTWINISKLLYEQKKNKSNLVVKLSEEAKKLKEEDKKTLEEKIKLYSAKNSENQFGELRDYAQRSCATSMLNYLDAFQRWNNYRCEYGNEHILIIMLETFLNGKKIKEPKPKSNKS